MAHGDDVQLANLAAATLALERISERLATGFNTPVLNQLDFSVKPAVAGWTSIIPPRSGYSLFISGIWWTTDTAGNVGFGQGQTAGDMAPFGATSAVASGTQQGAMPTGANGGFSMTKDPWVYRTDPGNGFAIFVSAANALVAGHMLWYMGDVNTESVPGEFDRN